MQINGKKKYVKRAVCFARALNVYGFTLTIEEHDGPSECLRNEDGTFSIFITEGLHKWHFTESLAHEMVHLRQYKHDQLIGDCETGVTYWEGKPFLPVGYMTDEYFLAPWEIEARALEAWLVHKWETRKNELH